MTLSHKTKQNKAKKVFKKHKVMDFMMGFSCIFQKSTLVMLNTVQGLVCAKQVLKLNLSPKSNAFLKIE